MHISHSQVYIRIKSTHINIQAYPKSPLLPTNHSHSARNHNNIVIFVHFHWLCAHLLIYGVELDQVIELS